MPLRLVPRIAIGLTALLVTCLVPASLAGAATPAIAADPPASITAGAAPAAFNETYTLSNTSGTNEIRVTLSGISTLTPAEVTFQYSADGGTTWSDVTLADGGGGTLVGSIPIVNASGQQTTPVQLGLDPGTDAGTLNLKSELVETGTATATDNDAITVVSPALTVNPTSGAPGSTINVSGDNCSTTGNIALVVDPDSSPAVADSKDGLVASGGTFSGTLTVPANADPSATYAVTGSCGAPDSPDFTYPDVPFDVTPAATGGGTGGGSGQPMTGGNGYREVAADGGIFTFGNRQFHGSTGDIKLNKPIVGGATDQATYDGYWIVASDGGVFNFNAPFYGSLGDKTLTSPAVEIEPTPTGNGYWIVQADGTVTPFGGAESFGDMRGKGLNKPIIGMSVAPDGKGYWLVAQDGGIFNFGSAPFLGSMGDKKLNAPVIDLAPTPDGEGYYLVAQDGGVFTFGSAEFKGSTGDIKLNKPVVAMLVAPNGAGYWLGASDGGIFTFGAPAVDFLGSMGGTPLNAPVLDLIN